MTVAAIPLPPGQCQFCDENGIPYAGGFVHHYYPGGTSPKDTYQNAEATVLNANPITLDSAGRATIFGIGQYRQILNDSLGNQIWDQPTVGFLADDDTVGTTASLTYIIDGGGATITTGVKGDLYVDLNCTITGVTLLGDQSGSIVVDIWNAAYGAYPPTVANSITASTPPTIATALKSQNTSLTGWTTAISAGSTLRFNVNSIATLTRVTLNLTVSVS